jgi:cytochrome b involved in lipid metabolism
MAEEIANLTRVPLGEGTLVFENWLVYSVEAKGKKRTAKIYYSDNHNTFCWSDDLNNTKSFFYRDSTNATTLTLIPKNKQGTELSPAMMKAMGFTKEKGDKVIYKIEKEADTSMIKDHTCQAATTSFEDLEYTMWVADRKKIKRSEREMLGRGLRFWFSNQPRAALASANMKESWIPLGFNSDGYEFRVSDWGTEGSFSVVKDDFMINVPGLDLNAVAKKYVEDLNRKKEESLHQNED